LLYNTASNMLTDFGRSVQRVILPCTRVTTTTHKHQRVDAEKAEQFARLVDQPASSIQPWNIPAFLGTLRHHWQRLNCSSNPETILNTPPCNNCTYIITYLLPSHSLLLALFTPSGIPGNPSKSTSPSSSKASATSTHHVHNEDLRDARSHRRRTSAPDWKLHVPTSSRRYAFTAGMASFGILQR
jgi:hypothetical protein